MEKSMPWFILKNLIRMAVLLLLVSAAAFFLVSASPLDPLKTNVGQTALGSMSQEQIAKLEEYWGMNTPPVVCLLGQGFLPGRHGDFTALPPAGVPCDLSEAEGFLMAHGNCLADIRCGRIAARSGGGSEPRKDGG